mgnify:CR=1 FL=1
MRRFVTCYDRLSFLRTFSFLLDCWMNFFLLDASMFYLFPIRIYLFGSFYVFCFWCQFISSKGHDCARVSFFLLISSLLSISIALLDSLHSTPDKIIYHSMLGTRI